MAEIELTLEQQQAIDTTDKTLLISAAAGAGKTSTLTARIIKSITRAQNPEDISQMLIVTFTVAATEQLKDKIRRAIEAEIEKNPQNSNLEKQLNLLPMAKICTIDSFCNDILRKNCDKVGVPPNYRIADRAELEILSNSILTKLINEFYEDEKSDIMTSQDFAFLTDALTSSKNDSTLEEIFIKLYENSKSLIPGVEIFKTLADEYAKITPGKNKYATHAAEIINGAAKHYANMLTKLADELILSSDKYEKACADSFYADADVLKPLCRESDYFSLKDLLDKFKFKNFTSIPSDDKTPLTNEMHDLHKAASNGIKDLAGKHFFYSEEELKELFSGLHKILTLLSQFMTEFDKLFMQEKIRRLMLEYADIERFAFKSLYCDDGKTLTDFALSLRQEYSSVYIDEYQDVNSLQAKIFDAISRDDNRFMVGDIKQSIYGFRSADPDVFSSMKTSFPKLGSGIFSSFFSIFMSHNFRSEKSVVDFVNSVFEKTFGLTKESIGYMPEDKLIFKKKNPSPIYEKACVVLVPERNENAQPNALSAEELECKFVANKISELLKDESLDPSEIAIIIRGKERMNAYADALSELGIKSQKLDTDNFFFNPEVLLALCLLNTINNPEKDIYLAGLLVSPIFCFTADDLYRMRDDKSLSLYKSLIKYTEENPDFKKGREFLDKLEFYRTLAEGLSVDSLLLRLYNDTGLIENAKHFGAEGNLLLLYNYAKTFSASSIKGLYNFIKFINNIIDNKTKLDTKRGTEEEKAVRITTVHSSKGLEYKYVFYVDTDTVFKNQDNSDRIVYSRNFGLSLRLRSPGGIARVDNPIHNTIIDYNQRKYLEEEFRVVYVALTRAISKLFIIGKVPEDVDSYIEKVKFKAKFLDEYSIYSVKSPLELILMTGENYETFVFKDDAEEKKSDTASDEKKNEASPEESVAAPTGVKARPEKNPDSFTLNKEKLSSRLNFKYANEHLTRIPEKLSVSILKPKTLDGSENEKVSQLIENLLSENKKHKTTPDFIAESAADEKAKLGIATHTFMQFFDVENLKKNGVADELERLRKLDFLSEKDKNRVVVSNIELFRNSDFFREMQNAKKIYREFRFNTNIPARFCTLNEKLLEKLNDEELLVQGVIDCILEDSNGDIHLVDYKTDALSEKDLANKASAAKKLNDSHRRQLSYYSLAIERIFGKKPKTVRVYSLPLGDTVDINIIDFEKNS